MERVTGEPLDGWEAKKKGTLAFDDSCTLAGIMLEQLVPTFDRVSEIAFHRDVNAHNILINVDNDDISTANFTLIDFGLAVDAREWTTLSGRCMTLAVIAAIGLRPRGCNLSTGTSTWRK